MADNHIVTILPLNRKIPIQSDQSILQAAMEAGIHINASCGGDGVCGKCRIVIEEGNTSGGESEKIERADFSKGIRLSCKTTVSTNTTIRLPVESSMDKSIFNAQISLRSTARIRQMNLEDLKEAGLFIPPIEKKYVELPIPNAQDHLPDVSRLIDFLRLRHEEHQLETSLEVIRKIPDIFRKDNFKVTVTMARPVRSKGKTRLINIEPGDTTDQNLAIAMDIGTTTVYGQIIDLKTGEVLSEKGEFNGQISYGEDVISRIMYAEKTGGLEKLNEVIISTINSIIETITQKAKINPDHISTITFAGNTTMTQLLLKITPAYIRRSPYVPASSIYPPISAKNLGINLKDHVTALVYPQISSYVGGDIVAGVMGSGMYRTEKMTLFIDIGTNAEIVIGNRDFMACAACSAGPAFEGGGITFGMRASKGAIEDFNINPETLEPMNRTIGNVRPKGICGSGLISITARLFEYGIINPLGKFDKSLEGKRIRLNNGVMEYVLAFKEDSQIERDIVISEIDIDNLIRAKGAIYSGCMTLLEEVGMTVKDIEQIILAGGFGSYVDLEYATTIGFLPEIAPEKIIYVGNSSLMGAKMSSLTNAIRKDVVKVIKMMTNFELSETPSYMDNYVAALFLPHTNINLFPKVKEKLLRLKK